MTLLTQHTSHGVTLHGDERRPGGVTFAFTERAGGVSKGEFSSLNLAAHVGDSPDDVAENRRRACEALGFGHLAEGIVCLRQVHGTDVVVVRDSGEAAISAARRAAEAGADAVVCTARDVPVLVDVADCAPVVLVCEGGFAVIHSGWRGTLGEISGKALDVLADEAGCAPSEVLAYVGPHIQVEDYEVSAELAAQFADHFGGHVLAGERHLSLAECIVETLSQHGVARESIAVSPLSTASEPERLFSFRASSGACGRQGALACLVGEGGRS